MHTLRYNETHDDAHAVTIIIIYTHLQKFKNDTSDKKSHTTSK